MTAHIDPITRRNVALILFLVTLATIVKILWAANSIGTPDASRFYHFGKDVAEKGPAAVYAEDVRLNHTLSVTLLMQGLFWFTGGDGESFLLWLRMPGILADVVVVIEMLLLRRRLGLGWGWLALAAVSPINLIICGFHGNLDGVLAAGMFLAVTAAVRGNALLSGFWLGLACHVKVVPLLLAPALTAFWFAHGGLLRFGMAFGAMGALLIGSGVAVAGMPFIKNVLGYGSLWGFWGISEVLAALGLTKPEVPLDGFKDPVSGKIATVLKGIIVLIACWLAWIGRRLDGKGLMRTAATTLVVFFALTPGFGHQYMVWWFAIVLAAAPVWAGILTVGSTALLVVYYSVWSVTSFPWRLVVPQGPLAGNWVFVSIGAWVAFVVAGGYMITDLWRRSMAIGKADDQFVIPKDASG
jgi:hypothetical protein